MRIDNLAAEKGRVVRPSREMSFLGCLPARAGTDDAIKRRASCLLVSCSSGKAALIDCLTKGGAGNSRIHLTIVDGYVSYSKYLRVDRGDQGGKA